jgi:hypothetical protein
VWKPPCAYGRAAAAALAAPAVGAGGLAETAACSIKTQHLCL